MKAFCTVNLALKRDGGKRPPYLGSWATGVGLDMGVRRAFGSTTQPRFSGFSRVTDRPDMVLLPGTLSGDGGGLALTPHVADHH